VLSAPYLVCMQVCFPEHCNPGTSTLIPKHNRHQTGNGNNIFKFIGSVMGFGSLSATCGFCKKAIFCFYSSNDYWKGPTIALLRLSWFSIRLSL